MDKRDQFGLDEGGQFELDERGQDGLDFPLNGVEEMAKKTRPTLNGERYITDNELSERLKISRRALQDYRSEGKIPYYQIGAKVLYKESDIEKILKSSYRKPFE